MKRPVAAALLFALLLAAVWWVPSWCLTRAVNGRLRSIPGYDGGVGGVRLSWWPLALVVTDLRIEKREETAPAAFVTVPSARVDVGLGSLLGGRVRLRIRLDRPDARFLMRQRKPDLSTGFFAV